MLVVRDITGQETQRAGPAGIPVVPAGARNSAVVIDRVHPEVWAEARRLAGDDHRRITRISATEVIVELP